MKRLIFSIVLSLSVFSAMAGVQVVPLPCGEAVMLIATPYSGYKFDSWTDGNTENPRVVSIEQDTIFGATWRVCPIEYTTLSEQIYKGDSYFFGERELTKTGTYYDTLTNREGCDSLVSLKLKVLNIPTYTIRVVTSNEQAGTWTGDGSYKKDAVVTLTAIPNTGYKFFRWINEDTQEINQNASFSFNAIAHTTWRCVFRVVPKPRVPIIVQYGPHRFLDNIEQTNACIVTSMPGLVHIVNYSNQPYGIYDAAGRSLGTYSNLENILSLTPGVYLIWLDQQTKKFIVQ